MSKKKPNKKDANYNKGVEPIDIAKACEEYMKIYGTNNNLQRHIPDIYDGLKLGERRLLYTMYKSGYTHDKRSFFKVATITGEVVQYHPHGTSSIYETLVGSAQHWNTNHPTIEGSGNFGSPAGDPAGADRYIEARLSHYSYKCFFEEFSPDIIDMRDNYSKTKLEPEFLPARYPHILISGNFGIGYGTSTSIPSYNLRDVFELTMQLMDDPDYSSITLVPDTPSGAYVIDDGNFTEICETGRGVVRYRGQIDVEEDNNALVIRSTPPQAFWVDIKPKILETLIDGKTNMVVKISNDAKEDELCYRIYLKKEIDPYGIRDSIYKRTNMEKTSSVKFKAIQDYREVDYNMRLMLLEWIDFRRETKRRYYNHKLTKAVERKHILETLIFILNDDNAEKTISIMKESENKAEIIERLMKTYSLSSLQSDTIAELKGYQYSKEARRRYIDEKKDIDKKVDEYTKIIAKPKKIDKIIKDELKEGIELFGKDRNSIIITPDDKVTVANTNQVVVFTEKGLIKKLPSDIENIGVINDGDRPIEVIETSNDKELMIFDSSGKISRLPVYSIQNHMMSSEGDPIVRFCDIKGKIVSIKEMITDRVTELNIPLYMLFVTKNGMIKKTNIEAYSNIRGSLVAMIIKPDDELVQAKILIGDRDILIYTNKGRGIRFNSSEVRDTNRMSMGVNISTLDSDDEVIIGMEILNSKDNYIFAITRNGVGKKCTLDNFVTMNRGNELLTIIPADGGIATIRTVKGDEKFKVYTKNDIYCIDINDVPELPRISQGKKLLKMGRGNYIIDIKEF